MKTNLTDSAWKVTLFTDDGEDETTEYSGVSYVFKTDGTVVISGALNAIGTWNIAKENDSNDDDLFDDKCIELSLNFPYPYEALSEDWEMVKQSAAKMELRDDSETPIDYLTFEKQ